MSTLKISAAGAHATVDGGDKIPAQKPGDPGYHTVTALAAYMLATLAFDPAGSAAAAQSAAIASAAASLTAHANAEDPHPTYLTVAEAAAAFDAIGAAAAAQAASQPLAANLTSWSALAPAAKQDASANLSAWSALATSAKQDQSAKLDTIAGLASITPLTRLAASGETVTTSNPLLDLAQTWNAGGVTFTGFKFNVTDTASASASLLFDWQVGGATKASLRKDGIFSAVNVYALGSGGFALFNDNGLQLRSAAWIGWTATGSAQNAADTILARDAANTLAQRNGTNAQAFRLYNTYTDGSNYERGGIEWVSNVLNVRAQAAGTGTQRNMLLGATNLQFWSGTTLAQRWNIDLNGHWLAQTDNTYDIGASGATRPRHIYLGGSILAAGAVGGTSGLAGGKSYGAISWCELGAGTTAKSQLNLASGVAPTSPANGDIWFDGTNLKMRIGGVTKTFDIA